MTNDAGRVLRHQRELRHEVLRGADALDQQCDLVGVPSEGRPDDIVDREVVGNALGADDEFVRRHRMRLGARASLPDAEHVAGRVAERGYPEVALRIRRRVDLTPVGDDCF